MTVGFQVTNDAGTVQIDELYKNYVLIAKDMLSASGSLTANGFTSISVSCSGAAPFIAWNSGSNLVGIQKTVRSGTTWTFTLNCYGNFSFTYYIFDVATAVSGMNCGLQVFATDGSVAFDSGLKYARVTSVLTGDNFNASAQSFGLTSGIVYAVAPASHNFAFVRQAVPGGTNSDGSHNVNIFTLSTWSLWSATTGSCAHIGKVYSSYLNPGSSGGASANIGATCTALAIDVTNY